MWDVWNTVQEAETMPEISGSYSHMLSSSPHAQWVHPKNCPLQQGCQVMTRESQLFNAEKEELEGAKLCCENSHLNTKWEKYLLIWEITQCPSDYTWSQTSIGANYSNTNTCVGYFKTNHLCHKSWVNDGPLWNDLKLFCDKYTPFIFPLLVHKSVIKYNDDKNMCIFNILL